MIRTIWSAFFIAALPVSVPAEIIWTGDVAPSEPAAWTSNTIAYIGNTRDGTLTVNQGSNLLSGSAHIGRLSRTVGQVSIDGVDSTWTLGQWLYVATMATGRLTFREAAP